MKQVIDVQSELDPNVEEAIDIAFERLGLDLTPAQEEETRKTIRFALEADPYAQDLLHRLGSRRA
jgi:hypothetical protein